MWLSLAVGSVCNYSFKVTLKETMAGRNVVYETVAKDEKHEGT